MAAKSTIYLMNPATGSVDARDNWLAEMNQWPGPDEQSPDQATPQEQFDMLIEVRLADGCEVPADFNPCESDKYDWVSVD